MKIINKPTERLLSWCAVFIFHLRSCCAHRTHLVRYIIWNETPFDAIDVNRLVVSGLDFNTNIIAPHHLQSLNASCFYEHYSIEAIEISQFHSHVSRYHFVDVAHMWIVIDFRFCRWQKWICTFTIKCHLKTVAHLYHSVDHCDHHHPNAFHS